MSIVPRLDHVQVACPPGGEAQARRFYGEVLGLTERPKPAGLSGRGGVWFALGHGELHVGVQEDFRPAAKAHPGLAVDTPAQLDQLAARLRAAGAPVRWDEALDGVRRFYTDDPFGNRLELLAAG
ncbi:MAG TPA: VOC family protein [Solirubrobacteraceae bacterium]|nr:VOC family protein [Solirubrobacteraceae bacterium]